MEKLKKVECLPSQCTAEGFLSGINVWLTRPNVVDKKVLGAASKLEGSLSSEWLQYILSTELTIKELLERCAHDGSEEGHVNYVVRALLPRRKQLDIGYELVVTDERESSVTFLQLSLPADVEQKGDILAGNILAGRICRRGAYRILYSGSQAGGMEGVGLSTTATPQISLYLLDTDSLPPLEPELDQTRGLVPSPDWLAAVLMSKLAQWTVESQERVCPGPGKGKPLVPLDRYSGLYRELKDKHGPHLIQNWPEGTDPLKFVHEDIAIAAYLLLLWEQERSECGIERKQSFVDLGCGNGLLVYLLSKEGHPGRGLDLRQRRTWSLYRGAAELQVCTLTPSPSTIYPEDWLLGNHSDELTPWLPVMAARSSYKTKFFVLPCCPWDFNRKFHRRVTGVSQYRNYLDYIQEVAEVMGFKVHRDTLRIPSSKRVCLIGRHRMYLPHQEADVDVVRQKFIDKRCGGGCGQDVGSWVEEFNPRESVEVVRNCTQLARGLAESIVNTVVFKLLETSSYVCCCSHGEGCQAAQGACAQGACAREEESDKDFKPSTLHDDDVVGGGKSSQGTCEDLTDVEHDCPYQWNVGGKLMLCEVADMLGSEVLLQLKKECGGLQTLLRNQHQVFQVQGGVVSLRNWTRDEEGAPPLMTNSLPAAFPVKCKSKMQLLKTKLCWFFEHHPQGCPRTSQKCPYAHGQADIRQRPDFKAIKSSLST